MRVPTATYRLQFNPDFRFSDARALIPYLSDLGISDIYASPILRSTQGSTHGYDVDNPDELNPQLSTMEEFQALVAEVKAHGMGWVQDVVPNHMAYSSDNWMLMDVFEKGTRSSFHGFFDIFWDHPDPQLRTRVLAPFLGDSLEDTLRQGRIRLALDRDGLSVRYANWRFPLALTFYAAVLPADPAFAQLRDAFVELSQAEDSARMRRQLDEAKETLMRMHEENPAARQQIDGMLDAFNRPSQEPVEQSPMYGLLEQQMYALVPWQVASRKINYRRFFYVNGFIALHIEDPQVFARIHHTTFELARADVFTGLRLDHVDGLYNPRAYLVQLRDALRECYIIVEKILELHEFLPDEWPIQGTSGYTFCNYLNGIFCRCENEQAFTNIYHEFIGSSPDHPADMKDFASLLYKEKEKILREHMAGEVTYLAHLAIQASATEELKLEGAREALTAIMAAFPVYRTYIDAAHVTEQDRILLAEAVQEAADRSPEHRSDIGRIVRLFHTPRVRPLAGAAPGGRPSLGTDRALPLQQNFLMRFQQFTGPAMAKGLEDTVLYIYNRFISLNEVGGDPRAFGLSLDQFHRFNESIAQHWPHTMNTTSTHDSKRGEDVRARLNVLSEMPDRWREAVGRWATLNERHKQNVENRPAPDRNDEYLLYQTLVGTLPFDVSEEDFAQFRQRIRDYMLKAIREGKVHTNWDQPNEAYENACLQFISRILEPSPENAFWPDFAAFQRDVSEYGIYNSLSQTMLKITSPGLPDFYQGAELWDFNLVDPDNRRPVDFGKRVSLLKSVAETQDLASLLTTRHDGRIKLSTIWKALHARAGNRDLFDVGSYAPATVIGSRAQHVVAFFRTHEDRRALVVVPRFLVSLTAPGQPPLGPDVWQDTRITLPADAPSSWQESTTGGELMARDELLIADVLREFPVALLLGHHVPASGAAMDLSEMAEPVGQAGR
jgi:(1->4)-alpha-D-glucan 1-alpha-D-glucosylmutase